MHERLRKVAAQLALRHVVLLRVQTRRAARGAVPLEPAGRLDFAALLMEGESHHETAQHEGALGVAERPVVVPEPVGEPVLSQGGYERVERRNAARIVGGHRAPDAGQQQRGVQGRVIRGALPAS